MMKYIITFIVGILLTLGGVKLYSNLNYKREVECIVQLQSIAKHIQNFKKICGYLPEEKLGLKALDQPSLSGCSAPSFLNGIPLDPWDKEIIYLRRNADFYLISSRSECAYQAKSQ